MEMLFSIKLLFIKNIEITYNNIYKYKFIFIFVSNY